MTDVKTLATSHARVAYRETTGPGLPLLLIYGNSTSHKVFRNQLDGAIGAAHRCIAFDLPGHGDSENATDPDRTYNMDGYASAATEIIQALGIKRYAVFGWSLGGHIALDMMAQSDALAGVMISGTPPISQDTGGLAEGFNGDLEQGIGAKRILTKEEIDMFARVVCGQNAPHEDFIAEGIRRCDGRSRSLMISKLACGVGRNQQELAVNAPVPLAIVNGGDDPFIQNDFIAGLPYKNLWDGKVHDIAGIGHAPFWEAPKDFDAILTKFLNDIT